MCGEPITRQSPQQIVDRLLELPERTRFQVLAPVVKARKGEYVDLFGELQTKGFSRAGVDGDAVSLVCVDENGFLRDIERLIKHEIPKEIIPGFAPPSHERPEPIVAAVLTEARLLSPHELRELLGFARYLRWRNPRN